MSYGMAAALQEAVYARLADAVPGVPVFDAIPKGGVAGTFLLIGPEVAIDASDASGSGAEHQFLVSVISDARGFLTAKTAAVAVCDALLGAPVILARGRVVGLWFQRAVARRIDEGAVRRIDQTFRARVEG